MSGFYLGDQRYANHGEPCTSTSTMSKKTSGWCHPWSGGSECWKPHTKEGISSSTDTGFYVNKTGITQCPHCQSSFCQPLRISFQSRFLRFDNISHVMISFSNPGWRHFTMTRMRIYLIFGDRPNLLISCCILAIPRFILQSDVKDTQMGKRLGNRAIWTSACRIQGVSKVVRPCKRRRNS